MNAELIFVAFLECQKVVDDDFKSELQSIVQSLDLDDGSLQTDGHDLLSRRCFLETDGGPQPTIDDDLCRRIGAQLAQMGDRFQQDGRITPEIVESLVNDILDKSLTEDRFEGVVKSLLVNLPPGMDLEKASLVIAMTLTSKVGSAVPNLLQNCFTTALSFIRRNCSSQIQDLSRQV